MRLIIVRHGETDKNRSRTIQDSDSPLNETGLKQADLVADRLSSETIDVLYSSTLLRARQTTERILKRVPNLKIVYSEEIRERDSGIFSGRAIADRESAQQLSGKSVRDWRPEGGESLRDLKNRAASWLEKQRAAHAEKTIAVISHGLFIYALLECAIEDGADVERLDFRQNNGAITILDIPVSGSVKVIHLNDVAHL